MAPASRREPRRRPQISREFLEAHRRRRFVEAAAELLHEFGREGLTVTNLVRLAGSSRNSFYEVFGGAEECIAHGIGLAAAELFASLDSCEGEADWAVELQEAVAGFYDAVAARPLIAELYLIHAAGSRSEEGRLAARLGLERLAGMLGGGRARAEAAGLRPPPASAEEYLAGAILAPAALQVRSAPETLPGQSRAVADLVAGFYLGPPAAR